MPNPIISQVPALSTLQLQSAQQVTLNKTTDPTLIGQWEYSTVLYQNSPANSVDQIIKFDAKAGAAYSVVSQSFFDPENLVVYDDKGKPVYQDDGQLAYGMDHAFFFAPYSGTFYVNPSLRQGTSASNQGVSIGIFEDSSFIKQARNPIAGTAGDDKLTGTSASDAVNGGAGFDTFVVNGSRSSYYVHGGDTSYVAGQSTYDGIDALQGVERVQFSDMTVSFETSGIAPEAYRLYQAAFGRTPDAAGLGYWIKQMGAGLSLSSMAAEFETSAEFKSLYGTNPTNDQVLSALYNNVLHRSPDSGGHDYWMAKLESHSASLADMLVAFSESSENQAQVVGALQAGFEFV